MSGRQIFTGAFAALALGAFGAAHTASLSATRGLMPLQEVGKAGIVEQSARRGGGPHRAHASPARRTNVRALRRADVRRTTNVNRRVNVNRRANVVVRRPVRTWVRRPYYGTAVAGVTLGTILVATTAGAVPSAPGPNLCWYWANSGMTSGYWDYCRVP